MEQLLAAAVAATLPALAIPEDKESASHTSGSNSASAVGSVTSISLLSSSSSSLAISTAELQEKLGRYRTVVLSVDTPSASRSQAIDVAREQKGEEAPSSIVLHKSQEVMEAEDICVDVSFKATLAELITDILQLDTRLGEHYTQHGLWQLLIQSGHRSHVHKDRTFAREARKQRETAGYRRRRTLIHQPYSTSHRTHLCSHLRVHVPLDCFPLPPAPLILRLSVLFAGTSAHQMNGSASPCSLPPLSPPPSARARRVRVS